MSLFGFPDALSITLIALVTLAIIHHFKFELRFSHSCNRDAPTTSDGGRGRIRTSVARKERQIYSLLVLATHPPVRKDRGI